MDRSDIRRGMRVRGHDGLSLGRVIGVCSDSFLGRTSFLLGRRYRFAFGDIESVTDGTLRLRHGVVELPVTASSLEEAKIDRAKYESRRLPEAKEHWDGTATSPLERARMTDAEARRHDRLAAEGLYGERRQREDEERRIPPNEGDHPLL